MLCVDFVVSSIKNQNQEFTFYYDTVDPAILAHHSTVQCANCQTSFFRWFAANIGWFVDN